MAQIILAHALLRRKELAEKVAQLKTIKDRDLFHVIHARKAITEGLEDVVLNVNLLTAAQVTAEYDYYARQLRLIDGAIQQANWATKIDTADGVDVMADYAGAAPERTKDSISLRTAAAR